MSGLLKMNKKDPEDLVILSMNPRNKQNKLQFLMDLNWMAERLKLLKLKEKKENQENECNMINFNIVIIFNKLILIFKFIIYYQ